MDKNEFLRQNINTASNDPRPPSSSPRGRLDSPPRGTERTHRLRFAPFVGDNIETQIARCSHRLRVPITPERSRAVPSLVAPRVKEFSPTFVTFVLHRTQSNRRRYRPCERTRARVDVVSARIWRTRKILVCIFIRARYRAPSPGQRGVDKLAKGGTTRGGKLIQRDSTWIRFVLTLWIAFRDQGNGSPRGSAQ